MNLLDRLRDVLSPTFLDITAADIDAARRNADGTGNCPALRAARRQFADQQAFAGHSTISFQGDRRLWGGQALANFTERWDTSLYEDAGRPLPLLSYAEPLPHGDATPTRIRLYRMRKELVP